MRKENFVYLFRNMKKKALAGANVEFVGAVRRTYAAAAAAADDDDVDNIFADC